MSLIARFGPYPYLKLDQVTPQSVINGAPIFNEGLISLGNFGLGIVAPTSILHIKAGTAAAGTAPIKFTAGTLLTIPEAGAMEYDGNCLSHVNSTEIRECISGVVFIQTANREIHTTTTETSIIGTGIGTITLPANFLKIGKTIRLTVWGFYTTIGTPTLTIKVYADATVLHDSEAQVMAKDIATPQAFEIRLVFTCRTTGTTGTIFVQGKAIFFTTKNESKEISLENIATTELDTETAKAIDVKLTWGVSHVNNNITSTNCHLEILN